MAIIVLLVDALKSEYVNDNYMPFTTKLARKNLYVQNVKPSFGFCERTEILTGMKPDSSLNFSAIGYDETLSEFSKFKSMLKFLSLFESFFGQKSKIMRIFRRMLSKYFQYKSIKMPIYQIPLWLLPKLYLTEDRENHFHPNAFVGESIIDIAIENKIDIFSEYFTFLGDKNKFSDLERVKLFINSKIQNSGLYFIYLSSIDSWGHAHNIDKINIKNELQQIDNYISLIYNHCANSLQRNTLIILGDHGMMSVNKKFNIIKSLNHLKLKQNKDYDMFIDSTIARFWVKSRDTFEKIYKELSGSIFSQFGIVIDEETAKKNNIPYDMVNENNIKVYGDIIFVAKKGVVFSPSYFGDNSNIQGMHGYIEYNSESYGTVIITNQPKRKIVCCDLIDICPTLSDLLDVRYTNKNDGKSLIKKNI